MLNILSCLNKVIIHHSFMMALISETDISSAYQGNLLLCIFCSQVSTHAAKKKIAETSTMPRDFLKKYDELKSKK